MFQQSYPKTEKLKSHCCGYLDVEKFVGKDIFYSVRTLEEFDCAPKIVLHQDTVYLKKTKSCGPLHSSSEHVSLRFLAKTGHVNGFVAEEKH